MEYTFTLKYRLPESERDIDSVVERLGEAGCTDGLVGIGIVGRLALEFTREGRNAQTALRSALEDVKRAIPSAILIEVSPDLVGLTDVAEIFGISRQGMRKLMLSSSDFPLPVHEGSASVWHLADLLKWAEGRKGYKCDSGLRETAVAALQVNIAKENLRHEGGATKELERLIA